MQWLSGLEDRLQSGGSIAHVSSVASFFLSRIDTLVDGKLDALGTAEAKALRSRAAIASRGFAYEMFESQLRSERWKRLAPARRNHTAAVGLDVDEGSEPARYILRGCAVAPQTVTRCRERRLEAYRDHGKPAVRIPRGRRRRAAHGRRLRRLIIVCTVAQQAQRDGCVRNPDEPFDRAPRAVDVLVNAHGRFAVIPIRFERARGSVFTVCGATSAST